MAHDVVERRGNYTGDRFRPRRRFRAAAAAAGARVMRADHSGPSLEDMQMSIDFVFSLFCLSLYR